MENLNSAKIKNIIDLLVEHNVCASRGEERKMVMGHGIKINGITVADHSTKVPDVSGTKINKGKSFEKFINGN